MCKGSEKTVDYLLLHCEVASCLGLCLDGFSICLLVGGLLEGR
jgi:hypothetical protein